MASRITESQRRTVLEMLAEGHERETIAATVGITRAQVSAVAAHVKMGTYKLPVTRRSESCTLPLVEQRDMIEPVTSRTTNLLRQLQDLTPSSRPAAQMAPVLLGVDAETGEDVFWNPDPHNGSANPHVLVLGELHRKIRNAHSFAEIFDLITKLPRGWAYVVSENIGRVVRIQSFEERVARWNR